MGYYNNHIPHTILRNLFENPGWYDHYVYVTCPSMCSTTLFLHFK